jgi:uncharacterized protein (DUF433 family)
MMVAKEFDMVTTRYPHIEITEGVRGGKPRIEGTRIAVEDVVLLHRRLGESLEMIGSKYDLPFAAVNAAMAFYYDHKAEIDAWIEEDETYVEAMRRDNPGPLQEKLRRLRGE